MAFRQKGHRHGGNQAGGREAQSRGCQVASRADQPGHCKLRRACKQRCQRAQQDRDRQVGRSRSQFHRQKVRMWSEIASPICTGGFGRTASLQDACLASQTARLAPSRASQLLGAKRGIIPDHILSSACAGGLFDAQVGECAPSQSGKVSFMQACQPVPVTLNAASTGGLWRPPSAICQIAASAYCNWAGAIFVDDLHVNAGSRAKTAMQRARVLAKRLLSGVSLVSNKSSHCISCEEFKYSKSFAARARLLQIQIGADCLCRSRALATKAHQFRLVRHRK